MAFWADFEMISPYSPRQGRFGPSKWGVRRPDFGVFPYIWTTPPNGIRLSSEIGRNFFFSQYAIPDSCSVYSAL